MVRPDTVGPCVLSLFLIAGPAVGEPPARKIVRIAAVDDLGTPIPSGLTICGVTREARTCAEYVASSPTDFPAILEALELEGPAHGPVEATGKAIEPDDTGTLRVVVPRKARVRFPKAEPRTVSLYAIDDPDMLRPRFRLSVTGEEVFVPAGAFVASILGVGENAAPDLRLLRLKPGETSVVSPGSRKGWSLVVRVTEGREPLEGAAVQLRLRDAPEGSPAQRAASGAEGFALFSGLAAGDADVEVSRKGYVPAKRPWTSARSGTFAVRHVPLERAGAIALRLESGSLNVAEVPCRLLDNEPQRPTRGSVGRKTLQAGRTDEAGRVRFDDVPPGRWTVRIQPGGRFGFDEGVDVESGRTTEKTVALERISVAGSVTRADVPIPAATVQVRARSSAGLPGDDEGFVRAKTGEDGRYEAEVFTEGPHEFVLFLESVPVEMKRAWVPKGGAEVDFELNEHALRGRVVTPDNRPVADATVALRLGTFHRLVDTGEDGSFAFPLIGRGTARVHANRARYRESEPTFVEVGDGPLPETVLTVTPIPVLRGRLLLADGRPATGQVLASVYGAGDLLETGRTDATGRFELRGEPASGWILAGGPACALTPLRPLPGDEEHDYRCAFGPATLSLVLRATDDAPLAGEWLFLRMDGAPVPVPFLQQHLLALGLASATDGTGRIDLVGLAPSFVEVFAARAASFASVALGQTGGLLTTRALRPGERAEEIVTLRVVTRVTP